MLETTLIIISILLGLGGIIGSIMPALPGPPLSFIGLLLLHFTRGDVFSTGELLTLGILTVIAVALDYALPVMGAKMYGASRHGIIGSIIGMFAGLFTFALPGMFIGMFLGAVIGEYIAGKKTAQAMKAGTASFVGGIAAMALKLGLCIVMLGYIMFNLS